MLFLWVKKTSARLSLTQGCSSLVIACCCTIIVYAILKLNLQTYRITASENGYDGATLTTADMFTRPFLPVLREAVESMADGDNKYGLKLNLHAVISRTIRSLKGKFAEEMEDDKMRELDMFTEAYNSGPPKCMQRPATRPLSSPWRRHAGLLLFPRRRMWRN